MPAHCRYICHRQLTTITDNTASQQHISLQAVTLTLSLPLVTRVNRVPMPLATTANHPPTATLATSVAVVYLLIDFDRRKQV